MRVSSFCGCLTLCAAFFLSVSNASAITVSPANPTVTEGASQQFTASEAATWKTSCGSISATGLFHASLYPGKCTVTATANDGSGSASTIVTLVSPIVMTPAAAQTPQGQQQQFTASIPVAWTAKCGTIASSGLYTASAPVGTYCTIEGIALSSPKYTVYGYDKIQPPTTSFTVMPTQATITEGATQQFTASAPATWAASCGTVSSAGLFQAPLTAENCTITATAASGGQTASAVATVVASTFTVMPTQATVTEGATQQFTASAPATWAASCGTVSSAGLFQAPLTTENCTITATATSGGQTASAVATVVASTFTVMPTQVTVTEGATQQFTASAPATWAASCGTVSSAGLFQAPLTAENCTITATATSGGQTASAVATIVAPLTVTPPQANVTEGATEPFTASAPATWSASCGTVSSAGLFQAPLAAENCTVTATAASGGQTASAVAAILSPITITPASALTNALATQQFSANAAVTWTSSCGTISSTGLFTAPGTADACTVLATASSGTQYTAPAIDTVTEAGALNYLTWKNDLGRTGLQPLETVLTPANVNSTQFGIAWSLKTDGAVWGQPLFMGGLSVAGAFHNVLFITTSNDSVYALDADTGAPLWKTSFLSSGVTAVPGSAILKAMPQMGVVGTPVIDPNTGTIYMVAMTSENGGTTFVHRLHALDVTTGNERPGSPVVISDPQLVDIQQMQRPGLLLANGMVYVGFGSFEDNPPYHGFVFAYDETTLAESAVFNDTLNGPQGGIWMAGAAPSADADGTIYVATGNGYWDGMSSYGDSVLRLSPMLQVLDYFTPYNQAALSAGDLDVGSSGVLLVPQQTGPFPYEAILCGKPSPIFVMNTQALGGIGTTTDNVIQEVPGQVGGGRGQSCASTPAFWNQQVYFGGVTDVLKMFTLNPSTGMLSTTPASRGTFTYSYPGAQPVISANGNTNGIVWTFDQGTKMLMANDATNIGTTLYVSPYLDWGVTWNIATVVNGHVYLGLSHKVVAFALK